MRTKIVSLEKGVSLVFPDGVNGGAVSCLTRPEARKRLNREREVREVDPERIRKHDEVWVDHFINDMHKPSSRLIDNLIPKRRKKIHKINLLKGCLHFISLVRNTHNTTAPIEHESSVRQFLALNT